MKLSATTVSQVPLKSLLPDPDQPRETFGEDALKALANNIKDRGVQVPLIVRLGEKKGQIIIKDGERRWRAAKLLKLKTVPCLLAKDSDSAQIRIDQVTVNNLREQLKPMEIARTLVKMRDTDKLTPNDIAAKLAKQGMTISRSEIENLVKLVSLPAWAQTMVNNGQLETQPARQIAGITDKAVLAELKKELDDALDWRGRVTNSDANGCIRQAYREVAAADLKATNHYDRNAVLFDYKKVCTGCTHLREVGGDAFCMDRKGFEKHQAEAKEAGLGPGGSMPKKAGAKASGERELTPAQQRKADTQKAEMRAASLEAKSQHYLHNWARARISEKLEVTDSGQLQVLLYAAACRPGIPSHERGNASGQWQSENRLRKLAAEHGLSTLRHWLELSTVPQVVLVQMAQEVISTLPLIETLQLAHFLLGSDITQLWKVDAEYLDLLQKAELIDVAGKHAMLPTGKKSWDALKTGEIASAILAAADLVGVPPTLMRLYAETRRAADELDDEGDDDGDDFEGEED